MKRSGIRFENKGTVQNEKHGMINKQVEISEHIIYLSLKLKIGIYFVKVTQSCLLYTFRFVL